MIKFCIFKKGLWLGSSGCRECLGLGQRRGNAGYFYGTSDIYHRRIVVRIMMTKMMMYFD